MANRLQIFAPEDRPVSPEYRQTFVPEYRLPNADGLSARALLKSLRRHRGVVTAVLLLFSLAGAAFGLGLPPRYLARGTLVIYSQPPRVADVPEVLPDQVLSDNGMATIASEVDVLQSRSVDEDVVRSLALWRYPEFQDSAFPGGWSWQRLVANLRRLWAPAGDAASPAAAVRSADADGATSPTPDQIETAIGKYGGHLAATTDGHSMTITVAFSAWTPELAAQIVNAHMQAYRNLQRQDKASAAQQATAWLNVQISKLRSQLQPAENAVAGYRVQHHLTGTAEDQGALSAQLAGLTAQLIEARANLAENEARAAEVGARAHGKGGGYSPEALESPTVQALRSREAALIEQEASLGTHFGAAYPELQNVRSSLRDLRRQIGSETGRSYAAALEVVERARARERSIERSVDALTNQVNSSDAGLRQLQERADSIRSLLQRFEKRMEETAAEPAFITSNSQVVTRADPWATAKSPTTLYLTISSGFVGLIAGALLALFLEHRDKTFQTSIEVAQHLEPRTIGATPRAAVSARSSPADLILEDQRSVFAEALRVSWTNIHLAMRGPGAAAPDDGERGTVLGITSAGVGEGKSTHALALARTAALAGESVVLVDADLRRSGVSRLFDEVEPTLNDFLKGGCGAEEIIAREQRSGMHFIASRPVENTWTSPDFRRFAELIDYLKERFVTVIIDLPPVLGLSETMRLATMTNGVVFIVRWDHSDRDFVRTAFNALSVVGVATTTVILNDVDLRTQRRRSYRDHTLASYSMYGKHYA
jgi:polysaccharide biosynthesis transport protein